MNDVMLARRAVLALKLEEEGTPPPAEPDLAFEAVEPSGKFSIFFDKGLTGLDFITELGVEAKATGTVSDRFSDELEESRPEVEPAGATEEKRSEILETPEAVEKKPEDSSIASQKEGQQQPA